MQYWVWSATKTTWKTLKNERVWAIQHKNVAAKLKKGDINIVYVKNTKHFKGIFQAVSDWYESHEPLWKEEIEAKKKLYPYQVNWEPIQLGEANFDELVPKLKFVENKSKPARYSYLQGMDGYPANHKNPIEESDFQIILEQMKKKPCHL